MVFRILPTSRTMSEDDDRPIGKWGRMHRAYLEETTPLLLNHLILTGRLHTYLADLDEQAQFNYELHYNKNIRSCQALTRKFLKGPQITPGKYAMTESERTKGENQRHSTSKGICLPAA